MENNTKCECIYVCNSQVGEIQNRRSCWGVARFQEFAKQYTKYTHEASSGITSSVHHPHPHPQPHPHRVYVSRVVGTQTCLYLSIFISFSSAPLGDGQPIPQNPPTPAFVTASSLYTENKIVGA